MSKQISHCVAVCFFVALAALAPQAACAAELVFKPSSDPRAIEVIIDPVSATLNVVEGEIVFSGPASDGLSVQIENGQSLLPIWPTPPQYDADKKSITFVGGVPNGFSSEGLLFRVLLTPATSGDVTLTYVGGGAYLNDGKGTKVPVSSTAFETYVSMDGISTIDTNPLGFDEFQYVTIALLLLIAFVVIYKYGVKKK